MPEPDAIVASRDAYDRIAADVRRDGPEQLFGRRLVCNPLYPPDTITIGLFYEELQLEQCRHAPGESIVATWAVPRVRTEPSLTEDAKAELFAALRRQVAAKDAGHA
jgi:hypothetical protein